MQPKEKTNGADDLSVRCLEAVTHYAEALGGEIGAVFRNPDARHAESRMPGGDDLVMNMSMKSDARQSWRPTIPMTCMTSRRASRSTTRAEFDRIFKAHSKDAQSIEMSPGETFWVERFAMFTDMYGTPGC